MVKKISISVPVWFYDMYLSEYKGNKSALFQQYFLIGYEVQEGSMEKTKQRIIELTKQLNEKESIINEFKSKLAVFVSKNNSLENSQQTELKNNIDIKPAARLICHNCNNVYNADLKYCSQCKYPDFKRQNKIFIGGLLK